MGKIFLVYMGEFNPLVELQNSYFLQFPDVDNILNNSFAVEFFG